MVTYATYVIITFSPKYAPPLAGIEPTTFANDKAMPPRRVSEPLCIVRNPEETFLFYFLSPSKPMPSFSECPIFAKNVSVSIYGYHIG
jgi:hypothetical protein